MDKEELKFMSDANRIKRYSTYLHHSFYIGQDMFIQHKHKQFVKNSNPKKRSTVFDRLEQDKKQRDTTTKKRQLESS